MPGPSNEEQYYLELVNDARLDPLGNAARYITSYNPLKSSNSDIQSALNYFKVTGQALLDAYKALVPVAPVAWNDQLATAARTHNDVMISTDSQTHQAPGEPGLGDRITAAGYSGWLSAGENVYAYSDGTLYGHAGFMVDWGNGPDGMQSPAGHRVNIMNANWTEVGIGVTNEANGATSVGPQVVTQDFSNRNHHFILGVAYTDQDSSNFYTPGEGRADLAITLGANSATSTASGGYSLDVAGAGSSTVRLSGGGLAGTVTVTLQSLASNVKLDVMNGNDLKLSASATVSGIDIIHGLGVKGLSLTGDAGTQHIFGTSGNDTLTGGGGTDYLAGGSGGDTLNGTGGNTFADYSTAQAAVAAYLTWEAGGTGDAAGDRFTSIEGLIGSAYADILSGSSADNTVNGGAGNDWLFGREGTDSLSGGNDNDVLSGGTGSDTLDGGAGVDVAYYRDAATSTYSQAESGVKEGMVNGRSYGISLDLARPDNNFGEALGDTLTNIENIWGSRFDDIIRGADDIGGQVYGFEGNDTLDGRGGNDVLYGGVGADLLTGGAGADDFFYLSYYDHTNIYGTVEPNEGGDIFNDFAHGVDHITLSRYWFGFGNIGGPAAALTAANADFITNSTTPLSTKPTLFWDTTAHSLTFDPDGTGAGSAVLLGTFQASATLTLSDIWTA